MVVKAYVSGFQFHLVRLKDLPIKQPMSTSIFQFHLVRLKVMRWAPLVAPIMQFQFHLVRLKALPIPNPELLRLFQFHLVRLKELHPPQMEICHCISIPFSTIKSSFLEGSVSFFQEISIPFSTIKSTWMLATDPQMHISIPFSTIKSLTRSLLPLLILNFNSI